MNNKYEESLNNSKELQAKVDHKTSSILVKDARDRFINLLNSTHSTTFESILTEYIHIHGDSISADECCQIIQLLSDILYPKIANLNAIKRVSKERAVYIHSYLDGKLYNCDNAFEKYKEIQKNNAKAIIDACNK